MGFRLPMRSDRCPQIGLAAAQQTIMREHTAAAAVAVNPKRALRNGVPHNPVNAKIGPTMPPCAKKISQVLRYPKTLLNPLTRFDKVAPRCSWMAECA